MAQIQCQLWMGSLEPDMTESFIMSAFYKMGECPQSVKVMRNKYTGEPAGYCFVHFNNDEEAVDAMHKLNGKPIPGTMPVVRFRLNNACRESKNNVQNDKEFSIWVGDLTNDVDDYSLYRLFSNRYSSIKTAKVILDNAGYSKGFGFVRFGNEAEQLNALYSMNGYVGLGLKPLKICTAVPRPKNSVNPSAPPSAAQNSTNYGNSQQEYSQYYDPSTYWQNYQAWNGYYNSAAGDQTQASGVEQAATDTTSAQAPPPDDDLALVDHRKPIDVEQLNKEVMEYDRCLWDALESSKWFPNDTLEVS